jgi:hypothetical protein
VGKCPAGPSRRQITAARRARADLRRIAAARRRSASKRRPASASKHRRRLTARQKRAARAALRRRIRHDWQAISKVAREREARKKCLRAHRHAVRTRNAQAGFVTAAQLARRTAKRSAGRG